MPEGQEGMPKVEAGKLAEKPISEYSFREAFARRQKLTRQKETASGDALAKIEADIVETRRREDFLVGEVEQEGGLMGLDQELGLLREMLKVGQLSPSDLKDATKMAPQFDNIAGIDSSDPHAGIREWYFRKNIEEINEDLKEQIEQLSQGKRRQPHSQAQPEQSPDRQTQRPASSDSSANIDSASASTRQRIEEIMQALSTENASAEKQTRLSGELRTLLEQQARVIRSSIVDPETGTRGGTESLPDAREVGADEVRRLFRERLRTLVEEQADQSFDQNWRLVYPLELTIMSLMPRRGETDQVGPENAKFSLSGLRRELSTELQAYRNIHNFIYVYRRVGGVTPLIEAASFLPRETISVLLRTPEVAKTLRKFEIQGGRTAELKRIQYQEYPGLNNDERKKVDDEIKTIGSQTKEMMVSREKGNGLFWANRIAGGLYSGLHESARHDMQVNESGDFFLDRLYHTKERAKETWERWPRRPRYSLYEAVDLELEGFWSKVLEGKLIAAGKDDFLVFCEKMGIVAELSRDRKKIVSIDLSNAKFEDLIFSETGEGNEIKVKTDEVRQINIDLDDADKIRKALFDPKGFLEEPSLNKIKAMVAFFKHKKGSKRSKWLAELTKETALLFRPKYVGVLETMLPKDWIPVPAGEIYKGTKAWSFLQLESSLKGMSPSLSPEDINVLLRYFFGRKVWMETKKGVSKVAEVTLGALGEVIKAVFGVK